MSKEIFSSVAQMKTAVRNSGNENFFSAETMRYWGTRIHGGIRRGSFYVTSDWTNFDRTERAFSVRWFERNEKTGMLAGCKAGDTLGMFATLADALAWIESNHGA